MMSVTRDEILNMQAGRELDALVHVNIMGLDYRISDGNYDLMYSFCDYAEEGEYINTSGEYADRERVPQYSTDIAAAWQVVEKLQAPPDEYFFSISMTPAIPHKGAPCWHVEFGGQHAYAPTPTLVICRAALLAVSHCSTIVRINLTSSLQRMVNDEFSFCGYPSCNNTTPHNWSVV